MSRHLLILVVLIMFAVSSVLAQTASITGKITGAGTPLPAATVTLLNATDSSWVRSEIADDNGAYTMSNIAVGKYIVAATSIGFITGYVAIEVIAYKTYDATLNLQKSNTSLSEATVTAKKPFIEMSPGKITVNIEGTTTTAGNVLDLMRRLPGITVDQNGNIAMNGKEGVLVLINERPTYLSGEDLAAYLKTITADETGQIELVTQPGARYDATGNVGVLNIKLRKNRKQGFNGNVAASYGIARYFHRDESILLSYRKNKLSLTLGSSDMEAIGFADLEKTQYYLNGQNGHANGNTSLRSHAKERFATTAVRMAADYTLSDKTAIGINARSSYHPNVERNSVIATSYDEATNNTTNNETAVSEGHLRKDLVVNAYLAQKINKQSTLDVNADYLTFSKNAYQYITTVSYNSQMQQMPNPLTVNSEQKTPINIYSLKADYAYTAIEGLKVEVGIKASRVAIDFDAAFSNYENNAWTRDTGRSNHFLYNENINAGYITLSHGLGKKWEAHAGLRAEQTIATGLQYVHNDRFSRNYVSLFPTAYLNYKKDSSNQFELNYGRRIDRPDYRLLNPFIYYSFQNNYEVGNPYLKPQYTNNMELKHSYKNMLITTLSASSTTDVLSQVTRVNDTTKMTYGLNTNFASNEYISCSVLFNKELYKWWSLNVSVSLFYATYSGLVNNKKLEADAKRYSLAMNTQLDLGKGWKAEAYANYVSPGRWSVTSTFDASIYMEAGASKKVGEHILIRAYAADPFYLFRMGAHENMANFRSDTKFKYASQLFSFAFTYTFGSGSTNQRNTNTIDEAGRVK